MQESTPDRLDRAVVRHVAGTCLCLHTQRAARALARLFDTALGPYGLTNGQFSLMMALNGAEPPTIGRLSEFLAMDRTSLTAMLKPLARRGLLAVRAGDRDRRVRHVAITPEGVALLTAAVPVWRDAHAAIDGELGGLVATRIRTDLGALRASTGHSAPRSLRGMPSRKS